MFKCKVWWGSPTTFKDFYRHHHRRRHLKQAVAAATACVARAGPCTILQEAERLP